MTHRLLDLFCGAGGAAMGYHRAGFDVLGVDIKPQPHYPFEFVQADALEYCAEHGRGFDAIHASPPCQKYSCFTPHIYRPDHPALIGLTRIHLMDTGRHFVIENVPGAHGELRTPILLCGSMFGLPIWRHRLFEVSLNLLMLTPPCRHDFKPILITDHGGPNANGPGKSRKSAPVGAKREAIGIGWMTFDELSQAIPPVYTEYIGRQLIAALENVP